MKNKPDLKIGIDVQPLLQKKTGVGVYLGGIIQGLQAIDKKRKYSLIMHNFYLKPFDNRPIKSLKENWHYDYIKLLPSRYLRRLNPLVAKLPMDLRLGKKLYFFGNFTTQPLLRSPSIIVVYDLVYKLYPQYMADANRLHLEQNLPLSIKKARHVITISEASKRAIIDEFNLDEANISVAYPAVDHSLFKPQSKQKITAVRKKYQLPKKYILYEGMIEPRKNVAGLIEAYSALPKKITNQYALVLVGSRGWYGEDFDKKLRLSRKKGLKIIETGFVPTKDLPAIFSGADLFVFPSFYEGFGIPVLEAMACGTPVITANNSSLPEVAGQAALMIDANNQKAISRAMEAILSSSQKQAAMRAAGLKQAKKFSWSKSAQKISNAFSKVEKTL